MSIKEFLKPDWRKNELFIILFIISTLARAILFPSHEVGYPHPPFVFGMPFVFFYVYPIVELGTINKFNFLGLIVDIIFWYFISCFVFWIFGIFKKKPQ